MTWKLLSILPHSESCPAASWSPWRLVLPLLSLSLQVRWVTAGGGAEETADLEMKIWLELIVGGAGVDEGELEGRWMGGLLFLLRMPMRVGFFWVCSACCWLCTCWWRISWTSSWGKINKQAVRAQGIQFFFFYLQFKELNVVISHILKMWEYDLLHLSFTWLLLEQYTLSPTAQ